MTISLAVFTSSGRYAVAIAELPLRTHRSDSARDGIAVVAGDPQWCEGVRRARAAGAAVAVVARPAAVPADDIRALIEEVEGYPVVVERPLLRADAAEDSRAGRIVDGSAAAPRLVTVDCAAPPRDRAVAARDAIGWLRLLAGRDLAFHSGDGGFALLEPANGDGPWAALAAVAVQAAARLHIHALGEVMSEVEATAAGTVVTTSTSAGRIVAPRRYESAERLSLRRALDALEAGETPADLGELAKDAALAERLSSRGAHKHD